ncbi:ABC transporter ATP-binding protein [Salinirussus salinus]|jgi:peptide/nickel transport system ATP-binding protein|uniref:ABC transporter ATP-binding protein n=1 Tax=Salinirussus salinus TaxID=1198300 RepID=UPI00135AB226|nr:ABC transporter ATP-binding protein [Salinirussus salinus]
MTDPLLAVEGLETTVPADGGTVRAVDGVDFTVGRGETVCLVGESGSGKTLTCQSLTGLVRPPVEVTGGSVRFDGTELVGAGAATLRRVRGDRVAHVFQNPQQALDPVYTVGAQVAEALTVHRDVGDAAARERAVDLLDRVGIPRADVRVDDYPHEFSGGMRQRVAIAVALAADPDLVVADEPTTAVDVTVQARLLELLGDVTADGTALLLVTHDLRVVAALADRVLAMYGGTVVERGPVGRVFEAPAHPYTQALFDSFRTGGGPPAEPAADRDARAREDLPADGCRFRGECPHAVEACAGGDQPSFHAVDGAAAPADRDGHAASCVYYGPDRDPARVLADSASLSGGEGDD